MMSLRILLRKNEFADKSSNAESGCLGFNFSFYFWEGMRSSLTPSSKLLINSSQTGVFTFGTESGQERNL